MPQGFSASDDNYTRYAKYRGTSGEGGQKQFVFCYSREKKIYVFDNLDKERLISQTPDPDVQGMVEQAIIDIQENANLQPDAGNEGWLSKVSRAKCMCFTLQLLAFLVMLYVFLLWTLLFLFNPIIIISLGLGLYKVMGWMSRKREGHIKQQKH